MKHGYKVAETIDKQVDKMLEVDPISMENCQEWIKFSRTVATTMYILQQEAEAKLRLKLQV